MDSNGQAISNQAFQEALARARQLAAKMSAQAPGGGSSHSPSSDGGRKRSYDDDDSPDRKRMNAAMMDPIGAQLAAMKNQAGGGGGGGMGGNSRAAPAKNQRYPNGIVINGEKTLDMMVPGNKVGYVIGKGGEMIRNLQERAGVKMTIFQETNEMTEVDKQLRIVGPPDKVDYARQLVNDLLTEKEIETVRLKSNSFNRNSTNEYGSQRFQNIEVPVPPQYIGLVIGKGGETIRRIQQEAGCKVQFDTAKLDSNGNKVCQISGAPDCVKRAHDMVNDIVENAMGRSIKGGGGGGRDGEEVRFGIPAHRTGAVIGRGGETIKSLKQQSGCDIELEKVTLNGDPDQKYFLIRGSPEKIQYAQALILDKVHGTNNAVPPSQYDNQQPNQWPQYWQQQQELQQQAEEAKSQDSYAAWAAYYAQYYAQAQQAQSSNPSAPGGSNGPPEAPPQQSGDPSQAANQEYLYKQWAEYYRAYGMIKEAEQIEQILKAGGQTSGGSDDKSSDQSKSDGNNPVAYPGYNYNYGQNQQRN